METWERLRDEHARLTGIREQLGADEDDGGARRRLTAELQGLSTAMDMLAEEPRIWRVECWTTEDHEDAEEAARIFEKADIDLELGAGRTFIIKADSAKAAFERACEVLDADEEDQELLEVLEMEWVGDLLAYKWSTDRTRFTRELPEENDDVEVD